MSVGTSCFVSLSLCGLICTLIEAMVIFSPSATIASRTRLSFKVITAQPMELCFLTVTFSLASSTGWRRGSSERSTLSNRSPSPSPRFLRSWSLRSPLSPRSSPPASRSRLSFLSGLSPFSLFLPLPLPRPLPFSGRSKEGSACGAASALPAWKRASTRIFPGAGCESAMEGNPICSRSISSTVLTTLVGGAAFGSRPKSAIFRSCFRISPRDH
mmetsp:Transcript_66632/g.159253  ORF Transcript_66632/g.159253 Transcript_66632/m.159253 type:complete len:214 (+) Transcript_66632:904-1545(+)